MNKRELAFVTDVQTYYSQYGRHALPWRQTHDPYAILVSEIMLQQTQVERVIPKYTHFISTWPTARALAKAPLKDVLIAWQGLGYNRRAKMLHMCAQQIINEYDGVFPSTHKELIALPGIGPYTAGAILAFAFNLPHAIIETNIRTVYLHHFFKHKQDVSDAEILALVERTLDTKNPRQWYAALMDYGSYIKQTVGNNTHKSKHYTKQSSFLGSNRQIRGAIIRALSARAMSKKALVAALASFEQDALLLQLQKLINDGLVEKYKAVYRLPG